MRARSATAALVACLGTVGVTAACGTSAIVVAPTPVSLSITAPTDGATVGVRDIQVAGTVAPATAEVLIGGQPARVSGGRFTRTIWLAGKGQTISITAAAHGYTSARRRTTVLYSVEVAAQIVAARAARIALPVMHIVTGPPLSPVPLPSSTTNGGRTPTNSANGAFSLHPTRRTTPAAPTKPGPADSGSGSGSGTGTGTGTGGGTGTGNAPRTTNPTPVTTVPLTADRIRQLWISQCVSSAKGQPVQTYCRCTYQQIALSGALRSQKSLEHLLRLLKPYERTHDPRKLPRFVRVAILDCLQYLPDNNVAAKPVITRLPAVIHPQRPAAP